MPKSRSVLELEQAINDSQFFTVSGEEMEAVRNTAKMKLVPDLWEYSQYYWPEAKYVKVIGDTEYVEVIDDTILRCMERFNPVKGRFSDYFKNQVKFAIRNSERKKKKLDWREGIDPVFKSAENDDEDESTLFETEEISDRYNKYNVEEMVEKQGTLSQINDYLEIIEKAFCKKQERIRPYLRNLLTLECFDALVSIDLSAKQYTWIDYDFLEKYRLAENPPTQKEVAARFGRLEQDASRAIRQFCEHVAPQFRIALQNKSQNC